MITPAADSAASALLLPGFEYRRIDVDDVTISCAVNGAGPPLLLLHGYPQNHLTWRHVAPASPRTTRSFWPTCADTAAPPNPLPPPPGSSILSRPSPPAP